MNEPAEGIRREMIAEINAEPGGRLALEREHGKVWDQQELLFDFEVIGFKAPLVAVKRLNDGAIGSLMFQHSPRYYFAFEANR